MLTARSSLRRTRDYVSNYLRRVNDMIGLKYSVAVAPNLLRGVISLWHLPRMRNLILAKIVFNCASAASSSETDRGDFDGGEKYDMS